MIEIYLRMVVKGQAVLYTGLYWDQQATTGDLIMR